MSAKRELVLRITPNERSIRVEEMKDGVTSFKEIALETFYDCVRYSIRHEGVQSGFCRKTVSMSASARTATGISASGTPTCTRTSVTSAQSTRIFRCPVWCSDSG